MYKDFKKREDIKAEIKFQLPSSKKESISLSTKGWSKSVGISWTGIETSLSNKALRINSILSYKR